MCVEFINSGGWAESTQRQYEHVLEKFLAECCPESLTAKDLREWLGRHGWGNSLQWVALCVVKSYLRWRYGGEHPALLLKIKRQQCGPQRVLKMGQVQALLGSFDTSTAKGRRDLAICTLMLDTGLRSAEVCSLALAHVDLVERRLVVKIKGGAWSGAVFSEYTAACISQWLGERERAAMKGERALFVGIGGATPGRKLTTGGMGAIMRGWARAAGLAALSPHDLRRTFATLAIRAGAPSRVVQAAGRWKHIEMVERYTQAITPEDMDGWYPVMGAMTRKL
jgi:site-specific recombinase XerD